VVGDAELVGMALRPLVENGLVYGPRLGMVTVTVTAGPQATRWEVHDGGARLTSGALDQLFKPFKRSDEPAERRGSGAGLGLTLARASAEVMGGGVGGRVDEHGTIFSIEIPTHLYEGSSSDDD
jgi:K+-sensing histidine kinase KdpD